MSRFDALQMATAAEMDLVEVSPTAEPPVVRIMDYGKFLFEQNKKAHSGDGTERRWFRTSRDMGAQGEGSHASLPAAFGIAAARFTLFAAFRYDAAFERIPESTCR